VVAHPDDEIAMAAAIYRLAKELGGTVDQLVITTGEGGFKYALLGEKVYNLPLTQEALGRRQLPRIRKRELLRSGRILGVRKHFFLDQPDGAYTRDITVPLQREWDCPSVRNRLLRTLQREGYDFLLTLLPVETTHGHHKAATVLALEAVAQVPADRRPVVLGAMLEHKGKPCSYTPLPNFPSTRLLEEGTVFSFDRTIALGHGDLLNYQIIPNWVIAEHKSQGTLQMLASKHDLETFRIFDTHTPRALERTLELFSLLIPTRPGVFLQAEPLVARRSRVSK
jgi:LmbE family N-acetylglucosaminyl deacetylase